MDAKSKTDRGPSKSSSNVVLEALLTNCLTCGETASSLHEVGTGKKGKWEDSIWVLQPNLISKATPVSTHFCPVMVVRPLTAFVFFLAKSACKGLHVVGVIANERSPLGHVGAPVGSEFHRQIHGFRARQLAGVLTAIFVSGEV